MDSCMILQVFTVYVYTLKSSQKIYRNLKGGRLDISAFSISEEKKVNPFEIPKKSGMNCYCAELLTRVKKKKEESCSCCGHLNETQIAAGIFLNAFHLANE